jgi:hypothetical protein
MLATSITMAEEPAKMNNRALNRQWVLFVVFWLFVIFVSVYDGYLVLQFRHLLHQTELNPLGRLLIQLNGGQVWLLLAAKFVGTVAAATVALLVYGRRPRAGLTVASALAGLQLCLLLFLLLT